MAHTPAPTPSVRTVKIEVFRTDAALAADPQLMNLRSEDWMRGTSQAPVASRIAYIRPCNGYGKWVGIEVDFKA